MNILFEIKDYIIPFINWVIFLLVITSGYLIRATKLLQIISTTLKVLFTSFDFCLRTAEDARKPLAIVEEVKKKT